MVMFCCVETHGEELLLPDIALALKLTLLAPKNPIMKGVHVADAIALAQLD